MCPGRELIPDAKVAFAHGQMRERELEQVMSDFYHQRFNILVCTTIMCPFSGLVTGGGVQLRLME